MNDKKRILIIDDDVYTSEMYAFTLTKAGYDVVVVDDGLSGEKELETGNFDVVLLDILLPHTHGDTILNHWRQSNPLGTRPPIIILTNAEQDQEHKAATKSEADMYIVKASITPRSLRDIIAELLNN